MSWTGTQRAAWAVTILALGGAAIAGTGAQAGADPFRITGCSLGCASGPTTVSCGIVNVAANQELTIDFSQAVDLHSVIYFPGSVRIYNAANGLAPIGTFRLGPQDRRTLVFQPSLSFGPEGNPMFGFEPNATYLILLPGRLAGDPPPYVLSHAGQPLENRLFCTITADQGVLDYVPGPPTYSTRVQVVEECKPGGPTHSAPAAEARCVSVDSDLTLRFHDVMNVATLLVPASGMAPFIQVRFAETGIPVSGSWSFSVDLNAKTTDVVFHPAAPWPPLTKIEVVVPPQVTDLVGNPHAGPGLFRFLTEK